MAPYPARKEAAAGTEVQGPEPQVGRREARAEVDTFRTLTMMTVKRNAPEEIIFGGVSTPLPTDLLTNASPVAGSRRGGPAPVLPGEDPLGALVVAAPNTNEPAIRR